METALVIAVDALPPEIATLRRHLDPSAAAGLPDHITVLYPFVPAEQIDDGLIDRLAAVIAQVPAFDYRLVDVRWFGDLVMWLAPDPDEPFRRLTLLVEAAFGTPPYEGAYDEVTPHLTIADQAGAQAMKAAAAVAAAHLPIIERAEEVRMLQKPGEIWSEVLRLPLGLAHRSELKLRPAVEADRAFARSLHHACYRPWVEPIWGWDEDRQDRLFAERWESAGTSIVELGRAAIGSLRTTEGDDHLLIDDIEIHPDRQGRGLGTRILRTVLDDADSRSRPVRLQVLKGNPARRLYERLGFTVTGETDSHLLMLRPSVSWCSRSRSSTGARSRKLARDCGLEADDLRFVPVGFATAWLPSSQVGFTFGHEADLGRPTLNDPGGYPYT